MPATPPPSIATAGLDPTFGGGGLTVTDMGGTDDAARGLVVDEEGTITVVGEARPNSGSLRGFALSRYLPDGSLDAGFGSGGKAYTAFGDFQGSGAQAVVRQSDGKLVVVGLGRNPEVFHDTFAVARYADDGTLDGTFGDAGQVLMAIDAQTGAGRNDVAHAVAIDENDRILVAGETGSLFKDFAVARYLPDGRLDPDFGDGGIVVTDLGGDDRANAIFVQRDGAILVAGSGWRVAGAEDFALVRYLSDGTPDSAFGDGGIVTTDFRGGSDRGQGLAVRPDGEILLGGVIQLSGGCSPSTCERYGFGLAQYLQDGSLDAAGFGDAGLVQPDFLTSSGGYALVLLDDGSVALAGPIGNEDFGLVFVNRDGGPIAVDGGEGVRIDFSGQSDRAFGVARGTNGTIVIAGDAASSDGSFDFGVARFRVPGSP
jgi:uncharacterized delta-60 repeat protein